MVCILVTAGPTREHLDDIRFLSNGSTGRMGHALAAAALEQGHRVLLVSGPVAQDPPAGCEVRSVTSALEMQAAAERLFEQCDVALCAAAVADHRPARRIAGKPPKTEAGLTLELVPNPDIAAGLGARKGPRVVVGFALESAADGSAAAEERGRAKLERKQLDLVVVNPSDAVGAAASQVVLLFADGRRVRLPRQDKEATADLLVREAVALWQARNPRSPNAG